MSTYLRRNSTSTPTQSTGSSTSTLQHDFGSNQDQQEHLDSISPQEMIADALNWAGIALTQAEDLDNNALQDMIPGKDLSGGLAAASALMTGVQSFEESPNQTLGGRGLDALLDVSGSLMVGANPVVGAVDTLLPKGMKLSELYDGTSSAVSSIAEGLFAEDSSGMENFMDNAKNGDYSFVMKEAVKAGEFWSTQF